MEHQPLIPRAGSFVPAPSADAEGRHERHERLRRFCGPVERRDGEVIDHWRSQLPAAHARAMIELARNAEMMVRHTGIGKDPEDRFPGFPPLRGGRKGESTK